ncbi:MAG: hypothetical protein ACYC10_01700 [Allorhizobium sp.]
MNAKRQAIRAERRVLHGLATVTGPLHIGRAFAGEGSIDADIVSFLVHLRNDRWNGLWSDVRAGIVR